MTAPAGRLTVALIPCAARGLGALRARTGRDRTDLVNRALTLYEYVEAQARDGRDFLVRDKATGETQLVRFL